MKEIVITINGKLYRLPMGRGVQGVMPSDTLSHTLRDTLGLTGTKTPCNKGECGGCTVLLDGKPVLACSTLTVECNGHEVITIEGVQNRKTGKLHPVQQAFLDVGAIQCGMCTPGIVMSSVALLNNNPDPTEQDVREALAGNICRCTGYVKYVEGVLLAAKRMRSAEEE